MTRLALLLGRQGSGKTKHICDPLRSSDGAYRGWPFPWPARIQITSNTYNHMTRDVAGQLALVSGVNFGRNIHPIHRQFTRGRHVVELPHSGYLPAHIAHELNHGALQTRLFVIELPEATWRGIGGSIGCITSPDYFMSQGRLIKPRADCDYAADLREIRRVVAASELPVTYSAAAEEIIKALRAFLLA